MTIIYDYKKMLFNDKNNHESNVYFRESASYWHKRASHYTNHHHDSTLKIQSKCKQLIEVMQCEPTY